MLKQGIVKRDIELQKKKALNISIKEGVATSFSNGVSGQYITPFALALKANVFEIGLLSSFIGLLSPIAQFFGSGLMDRYDRKKIVLFTVLLQSITWLPIAGIAILSYNNLLTNYLVVLLLGLYSILTLLGGIAHPPWFSWNHGGRHYRNHSGDNPQRSGC